MVDLLGWNQLFEPMWDVVRRTMNWEGVLSLPTLISVFQSYSMVGRINKVVMSFDVMDRYDVEKNGVVINWFYMAFFPTLWRIIWFLSAWSITKRFVKQTFFAKMIKNEWLPTSSNCVATWCSTWDLKNSCPDAWCKCKYVVLLRENDTQRDIVFLSDDKKNDIWIIVLVIRVSWECE